MRRRCGGTTGILALAGALALAGCGALESYATAPAAPKAGAPAGQRVAICYNGLASSLAVVRREAQRACPAGTTATPERTDWYLQHCPVLLPARATFVCVPRH